MAIPDLEKRIKYVSQVCKKAQCIYAFTDMSGSGSVLNAGCNQKYPESIAEDFERFGFCGWVARRKPNTDLVIPLMVMVNGTTKSYPGIETVTSDDHRGGLFRDDQRKPLFQRQ